MKRWWHVRVSARNWAEETEVFARREDAIGIAFRRVVVPPEATSVSVQIHASRNDPASKLVRYAMAIRVAEGLVHHTLALFGGGLSGRA